MSNLYTWLRFFHLFGLAAFLFAHGVSRGAALALRGPFSSESPKLLLLSQRSSFMSNPALLVVIVTGVWMAFAGHWWGRSCGQRPWFWSRCWVRWGTSPARLHCAGRSGQERGQPR